MKYVITTYMGHEVPVLMPELMDHNHLFNKESVVAAGFCSIEGNGKEVEIDCSIRGDIDVYCYGESVTLKRKSRGSVDAELIKKTMQRGL